jgi:hypothetical protein
MEGCMIGNKRIQRHVRRLMKRKCREKRNKWTSYNHIILPRDSSVNMIMLMACEGPNLTEGLESVVSM